jgi:patatin-like phospholipase/acyl hydrolase
VYQDATRSAPKGMATDMELVAARRSYSVLAIDGGGIRGVIPACVLQEIEHRTGRRTSALLARALGARLGRCA